MKRRVAPFKWIIPALLTVILLPAAGSGAPAFDHYHTAFSAVLNRVVTVSGPVSTVDYSALKKDPVRLLSYLKELGAVTPDSFSSFTESEQIAFLINAYNAFTLKLIIDHYPVDSIKDIGSFFSSPWKRKFFNLLGAKRSLDEIEHEMLRANYIEPRVHFALNCASIGCPALRGEAYVAAKLDAQLAEGARLFLRDTTRNRLSASEKRLYLSKIFKWFAGDFKKKYGSVSAFVAPRLGGSPSEEEIIEGASVSYLAYDWGLNQAR